MKVFDFVRIVATIFLMAALVLPGCSSEPQKQPSEPIQVPVSKPESEAVAPAQPVPVADPKAAEPETNAPKDGTKAEKPPIDPAATLIAKPTLQKPPPIRRPNISSGMDKYANFKGKRIGLVHMANMLGETDPCG